MVSNMFSKSLGYGGSAKVKTTSSIQAGGGHYEPASKASKASNGDLKAASNPHRTTPQNSAVKPSLGPRATAARSRKRRRSAIRSKQEVPVMASDKKGFGGSIGGPRGASPINSHAILEGDGKFDRTRAQPDKGAGSIIGTYSHVPVSQKDPKVNSKEPPRKASWAKVRSP
jgi:hypothetical protein